MFAASKTGKAVAAGAATDPYFNQTILLLNDTGTNGAQNNTFVDSSTNNFTITRNGNTTQGSVNPYQPTGYWSGSFNGSTQYLTAPANSAFSMTGDFTIEAWIWIDSTIVSSSPDNVKSFSVFSGYGATSGTALVAINANTTTPGIGLAIYQDSPSISLTVTTTIPLNSWVHIAFTRSGSTIYGFVNGSIYTLGTSSSTFISSSAGPVAIGRNQNTSYYNYGKGFISNHRVVKGTALYTSSFTPSTTPLTAVSGTSLLTLQNNRFIDNSSNNFTITPVATPSITSFSPFAPTASYSGATYGGTMYLDGTGDYVTAPANSVFAFGTNDFTIECWVYITGSANNSGVFALGASYFPSSIVGIQVAAANLYGGWALNYGSSNQISGSSVITNVWNHVAVVRTSSVIKLYVNGSLIASGADTTNYTYTYLVVGGYYSTSFLMTGYISNFRVVNGTAVYTASFTPPTAPVTAITNTQLLLNATNAGIYDATALNDMETVGNAQVSTTQAKWGASSMSFDGTGDWLLFPNNVNITLNQAVFTIEGWIYLNAVGSARGIVGKGTGTTGWLLSTNSSNQVVFTDTTTAITSTGTLSVSTWYHIAVVRSTTGTNQTKIYINGTNDGTGTSATNFSQTNSMYVGADRTGGSAFNGYMEDLRITKGVARYTANFTAPTAAFPTR